MMTFKIMDDGLCYIKGWSKEMCEQQICDLRDSAENAIQEAKDNLDNINKMTIEEENDEE